jgi:hypothetical protein
MNTYTYGDYNVSQVRLWRHEPPNTNVCIALYNKRKDRVYIHGVNKLTDDDIHSIREFIKLMKDNGVSDERH